MAQTCIEFRDAQQHCLYLIKLANHLINAPGIGQSQTCASLPFHSLSSGGHSAKAQSGLSQILTCDTADHAAKEEGGTGCLLGG